MIKYKSFEEAREIVRGIGIKSASEWRKYASTNRAEDIPSSPARQYKNNGWISWMDWLGNCNKQGGNRKHKVNDDFFKVWSHDMAYILGFWWADGHMDEKNNLFSITQHKDDAYILLKFIKKMEADYELRKHGENNLAFYMTSSEIIKDIKLIGALQNKTHDIGFPKGIPKQFLSDFIRGFWDGDGSVFYQKKQKSYASSCISASKQFLYDLFNILKENIDGFEGKIYDSNRIFTISVGVNDTRRLRDFLYINVENGKSDLYLKRKREKFLLSGEVCIASFNKEFIGYYETKEYIKRIGIKNEKEWKEYKKENNIEFIHSDLSKTDGWTNYTDFFDNCFWDFKKAREYVRSLNIVGSKQWVEYASSDKRIRNIPSNPWSYYKEWSGMDDWLRRKD